MSTDPANLLRMLEPAVRPDGLAAAQKPAPRSATPAPFERQPFEKLLQQAQESGASAAQAAEEPDAGPRRLGMLAEFARVENASLRRHLETTRADTDAPTPPTDPSV